ncbi:hypothetical protein EV401DRAFT_378166 [Pisolithus croceorrhizus]|nr:hypothetical protein EV401DRAFT_378166 [Pisolithus croceorrhizus]
MRGKGPSSSGVGSDQYWLTRWTKPPVLHRRSPGTFHASPFDTKVCTRTRNKQWTSPDGRWSPRLFTRPGDGGFWKGRSVGWGWSRRYVVTDPGRFPLDKQRYEKFDEVNANTSEQIVEAMNEIIARKIMDLLPSGTGMDYRSSLKGCMVYRGGPR